MFLSTLSGIGLILWPVVFELVRLQPINVTIHYTPEIDIKQDTHSFSASYPIKREVQILKEVFISARING